MKSILLTSLLTLSPVAHASMFGEETLVLVEILTTTASQLNELEKLVSNAEKYTEKIQKYNELFQDQYYRAERILYTAEAIAAKQEAKDLGELNWAIRDLKYNMSELKGLMQEYSEIKNDEDKTKFYVKAQKKINKKKAQVAKRQVVSASKAKNTGRATQITAQNTALILDQGVEAHNTQLEILEKVSTTNRLLAEDLEEKRLKEIEKQRQYGVGK